MSAQPFRRDLRRVQRLRRAFVECLSKNFSAPWSRVMYSHQSTWWRSGDIARAEVAVGILYP